MNAFVSMTDSPRTPLAVSLSVLLHGLLAASLAAYLWFRPAPPPLPPTPFELYAPPSPSPEDSVAGSPQNNLTTPTLPALGPLPNPKTPEPPTPAPVVAPPPTPAPPKPAATTPLKPSTDPKVISYDQFTQQQRPATTSRSSGRPVPQVGISGDAAIRGLRGIGTRSGTGRGTPSSTSLNSYLAGLAERLQAAFEPPAALSGLKADVSLTIGADGKILNRRLLVSSGNAAFDAAVREALDRLTFVDPPPSGQQETFKFTFVPQAG